MLRDWTLVIRIPDLLGDCVLRDWTLVILGLQSLKRSSVHAKRWAKQGIFFGGGGGGGLENDSCAQSVQKFYCI